MYCASRAPSRAGLSSRSDHVRSRVDARPRASCDTPSSSTALPKQSSGCEKRITHAGVEPEELVHERATRDDARRLVVLDDVAGLALLLEEVVDERLGLEREQVVDGRGDEEDAAASCPRTVVRTNASTPVPASPSFSCRSTPPERERVPPGKKSEW